MNTGSQGCSETIADEAIAWFVRMRGSEATALRSDFDAWIRLGDDRKAAYERTVRLFDGAAVLKGASSSLPAPRQPGGSSRIQRSAVFALAAGALLSASLGLAIWRFSIAPKADKASVSKDLITARGQVQTFRLAGGTSITLDTASEVKIIGSDQRHLRIIAGRTRVTLADGRQPIVVDAGAGRILLTSGTFDVSLASNKVAIALLRGRAEASTLNRSAFTSLIHPARRLGTDKVLTYGSRSFADAVFRPAAGSEARSWPTGWSQYRLVLLGDLIAQANRYASTPIVLDDHSMTRRAVAGRFHLADTTAFTKRIADLFDLDIVRGEGAIHLRPR